MKTRKQGRICLDGTSAGCFFRPVRQRAGNVFVSRQKPIRVAARKGSKDFRRTRVGFCFPGGSLSSELSVCEMGGDACSHQAADDAASPLNDHRSPVLVVSYACEKPAMCGQRPRAQLRIHPSEPGTLAGTYSDASGLTSRSSAGGHARTSQLTGPHPKGKTLSIELSGGVGNETSNASYDPDIREAGERRRAPKPVPLSRPAQFGAQVLLFLFFFLLAAWKAALFLGGFFGFSVLRFPFPFAFGLSPFEYTRSIQQLRSLRSREASAGRSAGRREYRYSGRTEVNSPESLTSLSSCRFL